MVSNFVIENISISVDTIFSPILHGANLELKNHSNASFSQIIELIESLRFPYLDVGGCPFLKDPLRSNVLAKSMKYKTKS